jgi:putative redox protein
MTASIEYIGDLRTVMVHQLSGTVVHTDAPRDNNGKGEAFSPTDMLASSYASCLFTIIGIYCQEHSIPFHQARASVQKNMASSPRRIGSLYIHINFSGNGWDTTLMEKLLAIGKRCPVAMSLHPEIDVKITTEL